MHLFNNTQFRSLIACLFVVLLSGIPVPILDAHPIEDTIVSSNPILWEHVRSVPPSEHRGVGDSEVHVHWVSFVVSSKNWNSDSHLVTAIDQASVKVLRIDQSISLVCVFPSETLNLNTDSSCYGKRAGLSLLRPVTMPSLCAKLLI